MNSKKTIALAVGAGMALLGAMVWSAGAQTLPQSDPSYGYEKVEQEAAEAARDKPEAVLARFIEEELPNPCGGSPGWIVYDAWLEEQYGQYPPSDYSDVYNKLSGILATQCQTEAEPEPEPEPLELRGYTIDQPRSYTDEMHLDFGYTIYRGEAGDVVIDFPKTGSISGLVNWDSPGDEGLNGYNSRCNCLTVTAVTVDGTEYDVDVHGYDGNGLLGLEDYSESLQWQELRVSATRDWQLTLAPEGLLADLYD